MSLPFCCMLTLALRVRRIGILMGITDTDNTRSSNASHNQIYNQSLVLLSLLFIDFRLKSHNLSAAPKHTSPLDVNNQSDRETCRETELSEGNEKYRARQDHFMKNSASLVSSLPNTTLVFLNTFIQKK